MEPLSTILTRPRAPREPILGTMLERKVATMLIAQPGIGKTSLGIAIACYAADDVRDFVAARIRRNTGQ